MKSLVALVLCVLLVSCSPIQESAYCVDVMDQGNLALMNCYEETALAKLDIIICNGIAGETIDNESGRIYSKIGCRNLVHYARAVNTHTVRSCDLIKPEQALYATVPSEAKIKNSEELLETCRLILEK